MDSSFFNNYLGLSFYNKKTHNEVHEFNYKDYKDKNIIPIVSLQLSSKFKDILNREKVLVGDIFLIDNEIYIISNVAKNVFTKYNTLFDFSIYQVVKNEREVDLIEKPFFILSDYSDTEIKYVSNIFFGDDSILNKRYNWKEIKNIHDWLYDNYKNLSFYIKDTDDEFCIKVLINLFNMAYLREDIAELFFNKVQSKKFGFVINYNSDSKNVELTIGHSIINFYKSDELENSFIIKSYQTGEVFGISMINENQRPVFLHELVNRINSYQIENNQHIKTINYYVDEKEMSDKFVHKLFEFIS